MVVILTPIVLMVVGIPGSVCSNKIDVTPMSGVKNLQCPDGMFRKKWGKLKKKRCV